MHATDRSVWHGVLLFPACTCCAPQCNGLVSDQQQIRGMQISGMLGSFDKNAARQQQLGSRAGAGRRCSMHTLVAQSCNGDVQLSTSTCYCRMGPAGGFMALMSGPTYGMVNQMPTDKEKRINVHFRIPYMTKWGQSIVVTGTGAQSRSGARTSCLLPAAGQGSHMNCTRGVRRECLCLLEHMAHSQPASAKLNMLR